MIATILIEKDNLFTGAPKHTWTVNDSWLLNFGADRTQIFAISNDANSISSSTNQRSHDAQTLYKIPVNPPYVTSRWLNNSYPWTETPLLKPQERCFPWVQFLARKRTMECELEQEECLRGRTRAGAHSLRLKTWCIEISFLWAKINMREFYINGSRTLVNAAFRLQLIALTYHTDVPETNGSYAKITNFHISTHSLSFNTFFDIRLLNFQRKVFCLIRVSVTISWPAKTRQKSKM